MIVKYILFCDLCETQGVRASKNTLPFGWNVIYVRDRNKVLCEQCSLIRSFE